MWSFRIRWEGVLAIRSIIGNMTDEYNILLIDVKKGA